MANKSVFAALKGKLLPWTDTKNAHGAPAYKLSPRQTLAQLAVTGAFNGTFYVSAGEQLELIHQLALQVEPEFIAKLAIYAREKGHMKDMPAFLLALLSTMQSEDFDKAFGRVVTHGKMLRNLVQILRSGATGRKSLGSRPKRKVQAWLNAASDAQLLQAAVGNDPSLADVVKMVHPKPETAARQAFYGWLIGKPYDALALPEVVTAFEAFKRDQSLALPKVPFQMLTSLPLTKAHWVSIAKQSGWQMLRQNLNSFARYGVFEVEGFTDWLAAKLANAEDIRKAKVLPYQVMTSLNAVGADVPVAIKLALQDALEIALSNVPKIAGNIVICPDVSGSMGSPVTGYRKGSTSVVRCIDVAALVSAALLRVNEGARVLPFEQVVVAVDLNPRDSVATNAKKLAAIGGGGTNCSAPLVKLVSERAKVDVVVFVSDNESWVDAAAHSHQGTGMMQAWAELKAKNPAAKLICIDLTPNKTSQAKDSADILNIGGFSDAVFDVMQRFIEGSTNPEHWVGEIEKIEL